MYSSPILTGSSGGISTGTPKSVRRREEDLEAQQVLPQELFQHALSFLPPENLAQACAVCWQWNTLSEREWEKICRERGLEKRDESESWRECALSQAGFYAAFIKGEALNRMPAMSEPQVVEEETPLSDRLNQIFLQDRKYTPFLADNIPGLTAQFEIFDIAQETFSTFEHPSDVQSFSISDGSLLSTVDSHDIIRIWDLDTQECMAEFPDMDRDGSLEVAGLLMKKGNILITRNLNPSHDHSRVNVHYLDNAKENFSFRFEGRAASLALQGNVLAVYETTWDSRCNVIGKIHLIDLEKRTSAIFNYKNQTNEQVSLKWEGFTLYIMRGSDEKTVETWDFSRVNNFN